MELQAHYLGRDRRYIRQNFPATSTTLSQYGVVPGTGGAETSLKPLNSPTRNWRVVGHWELQ
jgi:hypothetical protein